MLTETERWIQSKISTCTGTLAEAETQEKAVAPCLKKILAHFHFHLTLCNPYLGTTVYRWNRDLQSVSLPIGWTWHCSSLTNYLWAWLQWQQFLGAIPCLGQLPVPTAPTAVPKEASWHPLPPAPPNQSKWVVYMCLEGAFLSGGKITPHPHIFKKRF